MGGYRPGGALPQSLATCKDACALDEFSFQEFLHRDHLASIVHTAQDRNEAPRAAGMVSTVC